MRRSRSSGPCCGLPIQMVSFTEASGFLRAWQSRSSGQTWLAFPLEASNSRAIGMVAKCLRSETWAAAKCSGLSTEARLPGAICPGLAARLQLVRSGSRLAICRCAHDWPVRCVNGGVDSQSRSRGIRNPASGTLTTRYGSGPSESCALSAFRLEHAEHVIAAVDADDLAGRGGAVIRT